MWISLLLLSTADAGTRCLTKPQMPNPLGAMGIASFGGGRPTEVGFVDSAIYPLRIHYRRTEDAARAADLVLKVAETSWAVEIDQMGWPEPPPDAGLGGSDAYDMYLTNEGTYGGAYTFGFGPDVISGDNWYSVPSYIALDDRFITDADMGVFVSHEFNHALQYTIDANERRIFPWECTAEAMTDLVFDDSDAYMWEIVDFNEFPFLSLVFDGYTPAIYAYDDFSFYEYGGSVFGTFLEERYGNKDGTTLLALWDALAQPSTASEPTFVQALDTMDPANPSGAAVYTEFAVWRMFAGSDDDGAHYEEGALWSERAIPPSEDQLSLEQVDGYSAVPTYGPYDLGTTYYEVDLTGGSEDTVRIDVLGDAGTQWGLAWALWLEAGGPATTGTLLAAEGAPLTADVPLSGGTRLKFGVVNAGPEGMDGLGTIPRHSFTVNLGLLPAGGTTTGTTTTTTPTGDDDDDDGGGGGAETGGDKGGCSCDTGPVAPGGFLLMGFLPWLRRRR